MATTFDTEAGHRRRWVRASDPFYGAVINL